MPELIEQFSTTLRECKIDPPPGFDDRTSEICKIQEALKFNADLVPCHNDAFPKNWILDLEKNARLIDFEFSGNNDSTFDLATVCVEAQWNNAQIQRACELYYGELSVDKVSRVWLHSILFDVGWSLYAVIKSATANVDQFTEVAIARWERACIKMDSPDLERHLRVVTNSS